MSEDRHAKIVGGLDALLPEDRQAAIKAAMELFAAYRVLVECGGARLAHQVLCAFADDMRPPPRSAGRHAEDPRLDAKLRMAWSKEPGKRVQAARKAARDAGYPGMSDSAISRRAQRLQRREPTVAEILHMPIDTWTKP
jgi:hypothetical protein